MRLLLGHSPDVILWVASRIPITARRLERDPNCNPFGAAQAIGVIDGEGVLVGGVVYHAWEPEFRSVELSFAAETPRWLSRNLIGQLMAYPFETLDVNRINACTPKEAKDARRFLDKFGFRREGVATDGFGPGRDAIISRLLKREWLKTKWAPRPREAENTPAPTRMAS